MQDHEYPPPSPLLALRAPSCPPLSPHSGNDTDVHNLFFSRMWTVGRALDDIVATRRRFLRLKPGEEGGSLELAREDSSSGLPTGRSVAMSLKCACVLAMLSGDKLEADRYRFWSCFRVIGYLALSTRLLKSQQWLW